MVYWVLAGILGLVMAVLVIYARVTGPQGEKGGATNSMRKTQHQSTEQLVDVVDIVDDKFFLTGSGSLVALFLIKPILSTTTSSPDDLAENFVSIIQALEPKTIIQIVQLPLPASISSLTDQYARACYTWRTSIEHAQAKKDKTAEAASSNRYFASAQIGAQILQTSGSVPHRASFLVISRSAGIIGKPSAQAIHKASRQLQTEVQRLVAQFNAGELPVELLTPREAIGVLWHAYHPGAIGNLVQDQERFAEIMQTGSSSKPPTPGLNAEEIEGVLISPSKELRRALAPTMIEERETAVRFPTGEMRLYYASDFRTVVPAIRRMLGVGGKFAGSLYLSYYITSPASDEMARAARRASTAKQALQSLAHRAGSLPSYKQAEEIHSIEQARAGAETEKNVLKMLGLYLGLLVKPENGETVVLEFESLLRAAGVEVVPAKWMAMDVWRTLLPVGQRYHTYEERNLFSVNLAPLNPVTSTAWFEPGGEFCGFVAYGENTGLPVVLERKRGGEYTPSDAIVGAQNSGKSFTLKMWVTDWIARGQRVFVVDPKLEFGALTEALGGKLISLRGARGFNLLNFEAIPPTPGSDMGTSLARLVFEDNLAAVEALYTLAKGFKAQISGVERNLLINALKRAMASRGIDPKDASTWKPNQVFLSDVYQVLKGEMFELDPETVRIMVSILEQYAHQGGQYFEQYNTPNDFSLESDLITAVFGLGQLSTDETAKSLTAHFALRIAVNHAVQSFLQSRQPVPFHIVIDEASQLLTTPALVSSVVAMLSLLSAYGISVHLAFQTMEAIQRADTFGAAEHSASINTLAGTLPAYWLFHQEPTSAETAARLLHLPAEEARRIVKNPVGQCILAFPKTGLRIPLAIQVPLPFRDLFRTDPEAMHILIDQAMVRTQAAEGES